LNLITAVDPKWPEGYLSFFKDRLISNSRLSRASIESGLAKYILTKPFTGHKWRPLYLEDILGQDPESSKDRKLSTKTLADVVEALIGAAYQDGGLSKACKCISLFIHEQSWPDMDECRKTLYSLQPETSTLPSTLAPLEEILGYRFIKKSLLVEAMTHASFVTGDNQRCLERLEFIGDSVLDYVIVTRLFSADPPLKHDQMHLLKTAMVNGDFLAFISFESGVHREEAVVTDELKVETRVVTTPLWKFMRHASTAIGLEQTMTAKRHQEVREDIRAAMETGTHYPWALLAKLQARKFFSDIVEALLGAVWVDSGSLEVCGGVVERLGILPYLERILRDGVEVQHPKEVLGKFAVAETVRYETEVIVNSEGDREFACNVHVGSRIVTRVEGGVSKEEVKTKAATEAVRILRMEMNAMDLD
jgi:dsRNA-specific ribonuclease